MEMGMPFVVKLAFTVAIIAACAQIGKAHPSLGGLIATMPLTSFMVLLWLYADHPDNYDLLARYARGALWGIAPSMLFFVATYFCFRKHLPLPVALGAGFGIWLVGAVIHQLLLR
jgi:uncharacterized membrane protein (GlpM family)